MSRPYDVIVVGGGPAGVNAALAADHVGLRVLLVDENPLAGGQVYRALPHGFRVRDAEAIGPDFKAGERLRQQLRQSGVEVIFDHLVWSVASGFEVDAIGPSGAISWQASCLIVASGTTERVIPFPGWTTPGVIGLAAATLLLKSQQILPGRRTVVAGAGPLLAAVSAAIVKHGGEVSAVADLNGSADWLGQTPWLAGRPDLLWRGACWLGSVRRAGSPILYRHAILRVDDDGGELLVRVGPVDADGRPRGTTTHTLHADAVAIGHGLTPATEMTRLLGAEHRFDAEAGGWVPVRGTGLTTTVERLYAVGDGAGVSGATAAEIEGRLAGFTAARDMRAITERAYARHTAPLKRRLRRATRFGRAMARLMALKPELVTAVARDTIVCRCEDVTRGELEAAVDDGAREVNQLKAWTRCGMGPCQGRMCGETVATLLASRVGGREAAGIWTARVPVRPVPLSTAIGDFSYDDIPIPKAAPL